MLFAIHTHAHAIENARIYSLYLEFMGFLNDHPIHTNLIMSAISI